MGWAGSPADQVYPDVTFPNSYDDLNVNSTTDLSGVPDYTAEVQAAVNTVQSTLGGGLVQLPPGLIRINNLQITGDGVWLKGYGAGTTPIPGSIPAQRPKYGTYILHDNTGSGAIVLTSTATNFKISDVSFIEAQPPDAPGWAPIAFPPCLYLQGSADILVTVERCLFWGVYQAILDGGAGPGSGLGVLRIRDVNYATFAGIAGGGIRIYGSGTALSTINDVLLEDVRFDPDHLLAGSPNQQGYIRANSSALAVSCETWQVRASNCTFRSAWAGVSFDGTQGSVLPGTTLSTCNFNKCTNAIYENAIGLIVKCIGFTVLGLGWAAPNSYAVYAIGNNPFILINDCLVSTFKAEAFWFNPSSQGFLNFGPNCFVNQWDQGNVGASAINSNGAQVNISSGSIFFPGFSGDRQTQGTSVFFPYDGVWRPRGDIQVVTNGFNVSMPFDVQSLILANATTLTSGTVVLPGSPTDSLTVKVSALNPITGLALATSDGSSVSSNANSISPGTPLIMQYDINSNTWYG